MFCYGEKEAWYKRLVPNGMLPALSLDRGRHIITESDDILVALERKYGPLQPGRSMLDTSVVAHRKRERQLFRAWCRWLCYPARSTGDERAARKAFRAVAVSVEEHLTGPFMLGADFSMADIVYIPYLERMNASLFYYKGYDLRTEHPRLHEWFRCVVLGWPSINRQRAPGHPFVRQFAHVASVFC